MANPTSDTTAPWATPRDAKGKFRFRRLLPWIGLLILASAIAWGLWPKPVVVETGVAARGPLTVRVAEEGKTRVRNRYIVAAPVAGAMQRVPLKPGDEVTAGETVLTTIQPVDPPLLDPRTREQATTAVAIREAGRNQAAQALEAARAAAQLATAELERLRSVTRAGTISQADRDRAAAAAAMRAAEVRAAEFSLQVADYEIVQAQAALARPTDPGAGGVVEVRSPVSGRVLRVMQESQTVVAPGTPLVEIGDPTDIEIEAEILSRDAVTIDVGDVVEIDQWGGVDPLEARVRRVEPAAFTKVSALGVEEQRVIVLSDLVEVPETAKTLGDRYRVEVRVAIWHTDDALIVPAGGLFREGNAWKAFVYRHGKATMTAVDAGRSDGRFTEILGGISAGDELLIHPPDNVVDGTRVRKRDGK